MTVKAPASRTSGHAANRGGHTSGGLVVSPAICVHALGELRQTVSARLAGEQHRVFKERVAFAADAANLALNEPYVPNAARRVISEAQAISQNALAPPLPSATSYPSGRWKNSRRSSRIEATSCLTGAWRCDVPSRVVAPASSAAICSGRILLGPEPEATIFGLQRLGNTQCDSMVSRVDQCWGISRIMLGVRDYCGVTAEFRGAGRQWWQCGMQCRMYAAHHGYGVSE